MSCPDTFPCSRGEKDHDPKSGQDHAPDKLGCIMSFLGGAKDPKFLYPFFWILVPDPRLFKPNLELQCQL